MKFERVENPPNAYLLILFITYGGWLLMLLSVGLWYFAGVMKPAIVYLMFLAPLVTFIMAALLFRRRKASLYHKIAFLASLAYGVVAGGFVVSAIIYKALLTR